MSCSPWIWSGNDAKLLPHGTIVDYLGVPLLSGSSSWAFGVIQTPAGTYPTADVSNDTLTFTSTGGTVTITGNSTTDTINFEAAALTLPGGSNTNIQFNDSGAFGGDANLVWIKGTDSLGVQVAAPLTPTHVASLTGVGINNVTSGSASLVAESLPSPPGASITTIAEFVDPTGVGAVQNVAGSGFIANGQTFDYILYWALDINGTYYLSSTPSSTATYTDAINDAATPFSNTITWGSPPSGATHVLITRQIDGGGYNDSVIVAVSPATYQDSAFSGAAASTTTWPTEYVINESSPTPPSSQIATQDGGYSGLTATGVTYDVQIRGYKTLAGVKYCSSSEDYLVPSFTDDNTSNPFGLSIAYTSGTADGYILRVSANGGGSWSYHDIGAANPYVYDGETNTPHDAAAEATWNLTFSSYPGRTYGFTAYGRGITPSGNNIFSVSTTSYSATVPNTNVKYIFKHSFTSLAADGAHVTADYLTSVTTGRTFTSSTEYDLGYTSWGGGTTVTPTSYGFSGTDQNRSYRVYSKALGIFGDTPLAVTTTSGSGSKSVSLSWTLPSGVTEVRITRSINGGAYNAAKDIVATSTTDDSTDTTWVGSTTVTPTALIPGTLRLDRATTVITEGPHLQIVDITGSGTRYGIIGFGTAASVSGTPTFQNYLYSKSTGGLTYSGTAFKTATSLGGTVDNIIGSSVEFNAQKNSTGDTQIWSSYTSKPAFHVDNSSGAVSINNDNTNGAIGLLVMGKDNTAAPLAVKAFSGSPGDDLFKILNSAGSILSKVSTIGAFLGPGGSAAAVSLGFHGDPDTGFYSITTNTLGISIGGTEKARWNPTGLAIGVGVGASAKVQIAAHTTSASTAPLKFTDAGTTLMTTPEAGAVEAANSRLYFTNTSASRKQFALLNSTPNNTRIPFADSNSYYQESANLTYLTNRLSPTYLTLAAGTATAGTCPFVMTSGTLLTTAIAGGVEFLTDKFYATITTSAARKELTLNDIALTSGRVPFVTTNGRLTDDVDFTFATDTLTVTKIAATTFTGDLTISTKNIVTDTTTGTKIGTGTTQKLGFFNATPVVQQTDGATLTNNVTSGGTTDTIANYTDLIIYANDAAAIRNDIYQLARKVKILTDALRALGFTS